MADQFELKWQPVEAHDPSKLLAASQEAANAFNQAFKDQTKVLDTMFTHAQQHKMNQVQEAINALTLDGYTTPNARANLDDSIANISKDIGGFNAANLNTMNTVWDKRGDTLVDRAMNMFGYQDAKTKDKTRELNEAVSTAGNTIYAMQNALSEYAQGTPEHTAMSQQIMDAMDRFGTNYPQGVDALNNHLATLADKDAKRYWEEVTRDATHNAPAYFNYLNQAARLNERRVQIDKLQGDEKTKALDALAIDQKALLSFYGEDMTKALQNPHILARLQQSAEERMLKQQMTQADYQKTLASIEKTKNDMSVANRAAAVAEQNAATNATEVGQDFILGQDRNAIEAAKVQSRGSASDGSNRTPDQIKTAINKNVQRLQALSVSKELAHSFIGDDGEINPSKVVASVISQANSFQAAENNKNVGITSMPYNSWLAQEAPKLVKTAGIPQGKFTALKNVVGSIQAPDVVKQALIEAGIAGRLDNYSEGNGRGLFDTAAAGLNGFESNIRHVLYEKGMLNTIRSEVADRSFHPNAQNFNTVMRAVEAAYPTGLDGFINDNASTLIQNKPFLRYVSKDIRDKVVNAAKKGAAGEGIKGYNPAAVPARGAGKTLGQVRQPATLPTPKANPSPISTSNANNNKSAAPPTSPYNPWGNITNNLSKNWNKYFKGGR